MTLAASGSISLYCGACASRSVLTELRIANPGRNLPISMSDADVKSLAGVGSNAYSMSAFYGKSAFTSALHIYTSGGSGIETFPNGARTLVIEAWGSGGYGGDGGCTNGSGAGGGGSGGYVKSQYSITGGQTLNYVVGILSANSTVSSGTAGITAITASAGGGGSYPHFGGVGGAASGGTLINTTGNYGQGGSGSGGGSGGLGIPGSVSGDGSPYGQGGMGGRSPGGTGTAGQNGAVVFYYT